MSPGKRIIIQRNNVLRSPVNLSLKDKDGSHKQEDKQLHFIKSNQIHRRIHLMLQQRMLIRASHRCSFRSIISFRYLTTLFRIMRAALSKCRIYEDQKVKITLICHNRYWQHHQILVLRKG